MNSDNDSHETAAATCKDILAQIGPIDKLLGSVSYSDIDSGEGKSQQPVRASARVFKKMRFDQSVTLAAANDKKEKEDEVKPEVVAAKPEVKKTVNTQWMPEEKDMFFEALNEFGKDFENIHINMSARLKKRGIPEDQIKTKHQIRHFYYKTSSSFLRYLKIWENREVPKTAQELYALINYGELRRKIGAISKKNWPKLNELIKTGSVSVRIKGKTIRVKTPMCRALRRLNQLDEKYDDLKLPTRVVVELKPKDMNSFLRVQSMAQNPRIKMAVILQKRLSSVISCICNRWKSTEAMIYDKALIPTNVVTKDCVPDQKTIEANSLLFSSLLRLSPPENATVELPSIDLSEYFTGQSICLNAFEVRKGVKLKDDIKKEDLTSKVEKSPTKQPLEDDPPKDEKLIEAVLWSEDITIKTELTSDEIKKEITAEEEIRLKEEEEKRLKLEEERRLKIEEEKRQREEEKRQREEEEKRKKLEEEKRQKLEEEKRQKLEEIKRGWTMLNCGSLTIGEMYLMFGCNSKLLLEYSWEESQPNAEVDETINCHAEQKTSPVVKNEENGITRSLKKLLSLAKLQCDNPIDKCTCGHVCGTNKNNVQFKKPATTKVIKKSQVCQENTQPEKAPEMDFNPSVSSKADSYQDNTFFQAPMVRLFSQLDMQRLNSRCGNKRKPISKQLVVERKLVPNKSENKHHIVSMDIIAQENEPLKEKDTKLFSITNNSTLANSSTSVQTTEAHNNNNNNKITSNLDKELNCLLNANPADSVSSVSGLSDFLKDNDNQWISSNVGDFSLSSLLGHLDSTSKTNQSTLSIQNDVAQFSPDVDAQVHTLLIETSVDYTEKFADLAAQVIDNKK